MRRPLMLLWGLDARQAAATTPSRVSTVQVTESEFKIAIQLTTLRAGTMAFDVKNAWHIRHDLVIAGTSDRRNLISPGQTATLTAPLKPGTNELYSSVAGHEQVGMDVKIQVG
jgi:uncharacterized cupredoxin-like copper-binding protein